jgi:hypothetical protein
MADKSVQRASRKRSKKPVPQPAVIPSNLPPPSPLRGLLPPPPEVAELVAREVKERPMTDEARQHVMKEFTLQYYFGGHDIAYRVTPQGVEVLAAGHEEIYTLLRELPYPQHKGIILGHPEPWW